MDFVKAFSAPAIAAHWTEAVGEQQDYLGRGLFPNEKKAGLDLSWFMGTSGVAISLMPSAFDAKATYRDRVGFERLEYEMPFFREGYKIKERDRQELLRAQDSNDPYAQAVIDRVFNDTAQLISGAEVAAERMRMQLLFPIDGSMGISIKANGVDYTYNMDPDGTWKAGNYLALTGQDLWTASSTADPFKTFKTAKDAIRSKTGTSPTIAIMNTNTFNMMIATEAVKNRWLTTTGRSMGYLTEAEAAAVIRDTSRVSLAIYDKLYRDESKQTHPYVPDGYVALIPEGPLGSTWRGTTPEEADLQGSGQAEVSIVNDGVAIARIVEPHPVNINILASEIVLPSFERMKEVAVLKVAA